MMDCYKIETFTINQAAVEMPPPESSNYNIAYYLRSFLAGGICTGDSNINCQLQLINVNVGITHGALTPVDVVKTKIQLDPVTYNKGLIGGFGQVAKAEGFTGLLTGFGPTVAGYFVQGFLGIIRD